MSASENVTSTSAADNAAPRAELDISKLHALPSEQQDLYLLTFTSDLVQHLSGLDQAQVSSQQKFLKKELFKILTLSSPTITRVIRNNLGRCFGAIFRKGDRGVLFETVNDLLGILNASKNDAELKTKFAAAHCLGEVFAVAGESVFAQGGVVVSSLLKLLKASSNHTGCRGSVFSVLRKVVVGSGVPVDETTARDIWKQARNAATGDKSTFVQVHACRCLEQLVNTTPYFNNTNDFDHLKAVVWKAVDSPVAPVRHAAAACLARALAKLHASDTRITSVPKPKKAKRLSRKPTAKPTEDDEEAEISESSTTKKPETRLFFLLPDLLRQLSTQYLKSTTSNRARAGIAVCYKHVLRILGDKIIEDRYSQIATHLLFDLLNHPTVTYNRFRMLMTRKFVKSILEDTVGRESLRETSQLNAAKWLINDVLKDYPQVVQERREPSKHSLTSTLSALSSLIQCLGSAFATLAEPCREALLQVLSHPSYTVQIHAAHCLRNFVLACPHQLLSCVTICLNTLNREVSQLGTPRQSPRRCVGYANGLSAMLSTSRLQPLYGSVDVFSRVFTQATDLLKTSSNSELRAACTQIQVAWILIGGLMPLGPSLVKIHLSQLMLLWKNALPIHLSKENSAQRGVLETSFLAHVRECALGALLVFMEFNSKLITADGAKRIAGMLQNTVEFLEDLPRQKAVNESSQRLHPSLQLHDIETMVRRRVLQCFSKLLHVHPLSRGDVISQSSLLSLAISSFADPDAAQAGPLESSIAASTAQFDTLWDLCDNYGFGVTGITRDYVRAALTGKNENDNGPAWSAVDSADQSIDDALTFPIFQASEHDSVLLYASRQGDCLLADPHATGVVNAAIELFSVAISLHGPKVQESSVEQIATYLVSPGLQRNPGRKAAMNVNVAVALLHALKVSAKGIGPGAGKLNPATDKVLQELVQKFVTDPDLIVRTIGAEALGRLCESFGNTFTNTQVNWLVDTIVENREPNARAGCATALGCIHSQVGGMAAGLHLKTIVGVLMSLCNDHHPLVHFWALGGLERVANSAGLTFSPFVSSSLGMLAQLYNADTHNEEAAALATSNIEMSFLTPVLISRCVDSLINVLGPDLQDIAKTRNLILTLLRQFQLEDNSALVTESSKCLDHLSLYAPAYVDFSGYVKRLQVELSADNPLMRDVAIRGLSNLMKRDAASVIRTATPALEEDIWLAFDDTPDNPILKGMIQDWMQQTALEETELWIQRCHNTLTKTRFKAEEPPLTSAVKPSANDMPDDEVAGFASAIAGAGQSDGTNDTVSGQELLKWQTRNFVMSCLSELLCFVQEAILPDQVIPAELALQQKVGDIVRMAFSASTANVIELRIWGLKIIDQVLRMFGKTPDPDFTEASLLEQYQAQIGSALTPAFAADSSAELASEAINVSATFIATGIVTNVERMGRILKLLVLGLENFSNNLDTTEIGELKGLNSNARVMVKMALYSAWARLQIASIEQEYLNEVVQPYLTKLTPLWLSSLQEYARLRFEPDISGSLGTGPLGGDLDEVYAALNRETLLKFYQDSWLNLVDAIAGLVERDIDFVFDALDGKSELEKSKPDEEEQAASKEEVGSKGHDINYRDEPVAFFFVLFGLAFEALVDQSTTPSQRLEILQALKRILRPVISGNAIYQDAIFSETMDSLDRLALTEGTPIQNVIVEIARNLSLDHPSAKGGEDRDDHLSDDIEQLFELTRSIILVLAGLLPNLRESAPLARFGVGSEDALSLIRLSLSSLVNVASIFPSIIRNDLNACILHIFSTILATGLCQAEVVPQALPTFKHFISSVSNSPDIGPEDPENVAVVSRQLRGCLTRFLTTLTLAQRRESESSLPCAKNTLLAIAILLTTGGHLIPPQDPVVPRVLDELLDCLQDVGLANVAAGCIRSILLTSTPKSTTSEAIARYLTPRLIAFYVGCPRENGDIANDPENSKTVIARTLVSCVTNAVFSADATPTAMSLVMSTLLSRAEREGTAVYTETSAHLLELAKANQVIFRALVATMQPAQKSMLEDILRSSDANSGANKQARDRADSDHEQQSMPSIALRMDF
ncbi:AP-1 complex accessory protein LAA1 [Aspergillus saccharolyticus JOP 1030-1]|uniref:ARM repeat-containing protein n=1 Tax=Aspergillus saccharolyticus JOP 1030-1 TaxID=1450539 RepID=A0A318ZVU0_9EURO|nr:ARM repeat-containing protein [Aspergillus saccharolyticus JOP 1030-1]PYH48190.1 ARM repeat-containing protein [Aspergillus saccharolyticus JOP 1030-1]